jgi:flagellar motor switch/type III secretory pathway protein FliN
MSAGDGIRIAPIAPVDAPGRRDLHVLCAWAAVSSAEAGEEMRRRVGVAGGTIRCSASILHDPENWQYAPDAAWLAVHWGSVTGYIAVPASLAASVVTTALGYDHTSYLPLTPLDWQVLYTCLMPMIDRLQERAGWDASGSLQLTDSRALQELGAGPVALWSVSMRGGAVDGCWQLAVPWEALRNSVRNSKLHAERQRRIPWTALQGATVEIEAMIGGGTLPLAHTVELSVGDIVALDRDVSETVELRVAGQRMGEGRLGSRAGKWALRLTQLDYDENDPAVTEERHD